MTKHVLLLSCALGALTMTAGGAYAATATAAATDTAPATAAETGAGNSIGELVVTAERREQNIQEVPVAVTAFSAQQRAIEGINTVQDMTNFTPGLTYSSQLDRPVMRGLARNNNIYLSDSAVAVYYDDFFSNSTFLVGRDDMLIDQVEVLLGPQGTLYGRNAVGGLINTISKHPADTFGGEVRADIGNYGYLFTEATVTGPVPGIDGLTFRLSGYDLNQTRGYFKNLVPGAPSEGNVRHDPYGDVQLEYKNSRTDLWLDTYAVGFNQDRGGPGGLLGIPTGGHYDTALATEGQLTFNPNFPYGGGAIPGSVVGMIPGTTDNPALGNIRDFAHAFPTTITLHGAYAVVLHATEHFDGFDAKYIGGYSQYRYALHTSYFNNDNSSITSYQIPLNPISACGLGFLGPCGPLTVNPLQIFQYETRTAWWSQELNFTSTTNGPIQWIAGVYRYDETDNNPEYGQEPDQPQLAFPSPATAFPSLPNPTRDEFLLDYQDHIQSTAGYGQVDWKITDTLKLTGGLRYTYDHKTGTEEARFVAFQNVAIVTAAGPLTAGNFGSALPALDITPTLISFAPQKGVTCLPTLATTGPFAGDFTRCLGDSSSAVTGTAGVEWTPDTDTLVYARYNRGYKAFGLNAGFIGAHAEALPEFVDDFEVGLKKTFNRTLVVDADAFYYNYTNAQIPIGVPIFSAATGVTNTVTEFTNIPKSVSAGFEMTANWNPVEHLNLSLVYGYNYTRISSTCTLVGGVATGACYVDPEDPRAQAVGARPVGGLAGTSIVQAVNGSELPQAPANKVAFNANYTFVWDPGSLTLSGSYIWKDISYASIFRRAYDSAPAWDQVDLRATWAGNHDRYEVILYVKNVFNSLGYDAAAAAYLISAPVGGGPYTQAQSYDLTPPRLYGVEVHVKF
jgi:iron complex outermembrane receptor protein